jgi:hypothetical protein
MRFVHWNEFHFEPRPAGEIWVNRANPCQVKGYRDAWHYVKIVEDAYRVLSER